MPDFELMYFFITFHLLHIVCRQLNNNSVLFLLFNLYLKSSKAAYYSR